MKKFYSRELSKRFCRRSKTDESHNNRRRPDRKDVRVRDRESKKRTTCIQCHKHRALTNLAGWSKQLCTTCAQKAKINFPPKKILNKRKAKRKEEGTEFEEQVKVKKEKDRRNKGVKKKVKVKKEPKVIVEATSRKEQKPLEKRKMRKSNLQFLPAEDMEEPDKGAGEGADVEDQILSLINWIHYTISCGFVIFGGFDEFH